MVSCLDEERERGEVRLEVTFKESERAIIGERNGYGNEKRDGETCDI